MIEGCIVAKLVLGYLTDEGLHRTCVAFQEECSLFHNGNSNLDQVLLTSDLKTILEDYSQLKETGRENGIPTSTAVLKSLWSDLDVVIGQLKYATIPTNASKVNTMRNQSTRTRRLNYDRSRRSTIQNNHERVMTTSSTNQRPSTPLPLPRLSTASTSRLSSPNNSHTANSSLSCAGARTLSGVQSTASKDINLCQASNSTQSVGNPVADNVAKVRDTPPAAAPVVENELQVRGPPRSCAPVTAAVTAAVTASSFGNSHTNNEQCSNEDAGESMFDVMDDGDFSGADHDSTETTPVIGISDESSKDLQMVAAEEHSLSHSNPSQNELQLRSPKRKGVQPKKRFPQGDPGTSAVTDSPVKQVSKSANQEFEMDIMSASDSLTSQSFLGTLLNTPLLQEKLAENINKVVGSSRAPANDEPPSDSTQSMTTTEASSDDALMVSNQEAGGNIPVKEIMDLMQADPAFDVLFSFFGLDALDALPSAANSSPVLAWTSTDSSQADKSTSASEAHSLADTLGALPSLPTESVPHLGNEITPPSGSSQQQVTPSSSSASDLHLSAASIVTDALLLLAGSPQKTPSQTSSQMSYSASDLMSEMQNLGTPPKTSHAVQRNSANEKRPGQQCSQPALITSTLPHVRALNFALGQEKVPGKGGRKKGSKNKTGTKQNTTINEQSKATSNKKGGRRQAATKKPPGLTSASSSDTGFGFRTVQAMPCSNNTNGQQLVNSGRAFNRTILPNPSPVNVMMTSSHPNPSPYTLVNCAPDPTFLPVNVIRSSPSPVNVISCSAAHTPSVVTYITPATGLPTGVIPTSGSHASAVPCQSPVPVNHTSLGTNVTPSPFNFNSLSTCHIPTSVNFTASSSVRVSSPLVLNSVSSVSNPSTISLTTLYPPLQPSTVNVASTGTGHVPSVVNIANTGTGHVPSVVNVANTGNGHVPSVVNIANTGTGHVPSVVNVANTGNGHVPSVVNIANTGTSHVPLPSGFMKLNIPSVSSAASPHQPINTVASQAVIPGRLAESTVISATADIRIPITCQADSNAGVSSGSAPSETVGAGVNAFSTSMESFSLEASNLLQTLAQKQANTRANSTGPFKPASESDAGQLSVHSLQTNVPHSTVEAEIGHQPLQEKSAPQGNANVSKNSAEVSREKLVGAGISLVQDSPNRNPLEQDLRKAVPVETNLQNPFGNTNGATSSLAILNQECSEMMKENTVGLLHSKQSGERERLGSSSSQRKRQWDEFQQQKEKTTRSSSRPSKRSRTKGESMNFPTNLNVEEFLSKLHYEDK